MNEQCNLLNLHRSGIYFTPKFESVLNLEFIFQIDKLYIKDHTLCTCRINLMLQMMGYKIGRKIKFEKIYINPPVDEIELFKICEEFIN